MEIIKFDELKRGYVGIIGKSEIPVRSIIHYISNLSNDYAKVIMIQRIGELFLKGAQDKNFFVTTNSVNWLPDYNSNSWVKNNYENQKYLMMAEKSENPEKFWNIIKNYARPVVFYKNNNNIIPLYNYEHKSSDSFKLVHFYENSPFLIEIIGAIAALVTIVYTIKGDYRQSESHKSDELYKSVNTLEKIVSCSKFINDNNVPAGYRAYAENTLEYYKHKHKEYANKLGIVKLHIDIEK